VLQPAIRRGHILMILKKKKAYTLNVP
jgi:hypothetical protein